MKNPMPNFNPQDIFQQFFGNSGFGGFGGFGGNQSQPNVQMEHCMVEKEVTLEDLFLEKVLSVNYKQKNYCKKCNGNGTKDGNPSCCNGCKGSGKKVQVIQRGNSIQQMISSCNECNGRGESANKNNMCDECKGVKFIIKDKSIDVPLNKSITNGNKLVVEGKGNIYKNQKTNVIVVIKEMPHQTFKRNGKDLHTNIKLRLFQTLFGFSKSITHLDGRTLLIKYSDIRKMDVMLEVKNEGMGGSLFIHLSTSIPHLDKLEENEKIMLKKLLIKANLSEYQKELNLLKNSTQHTIIPSSNISEIEIDENEDDPVQESQNPHHPGFENVQCAQQ
jgi:DnaJ family protein A protein 2